jgi:hypothetical protein
VRGNNGVVGNLATGGDDCRINGSVFVRRGLDEEAAAVEETKFGSGGGGLERPALTKESK